MKLNQSDSLNFNIVIRDDEKTYNKNRMFFAFENALLTLTIFLIHVKYPTYNDISY